MIDSINLSLEDIYLNLNYLKKIEIKWKNSKDRLYISFNYGDVKFVYYKPFRTLSLETTTHKLLRENDITLKHKIIFVERINNIINIICNTNNIVYNFKLTRIDYYVDISANDLKRIYIILLKKHKSLYKRMVEDTKYDTSKYLRSSGKGLNLYDKEQQMKDKKSPLIDWDYKLHNGVIRLEVQIYNKKLKYEEKYHNVKRTLDTYWTKESMEKYYFKLLEGYLYTGDYYSLTLANDIIQDSENRKSTKIKLISFIVDVMLRSIDNLNEIYSYNTIRRYIEKLNVLEVNPIIIDNKFNTNHLENLLNIARKTVEEKYFK